MADHPPYSDDQPRLLGADDWELLRDVRLRALADSPDAFGSTLERERGFDEAEWRRRLAGPVAAVVKDARPVAMGGTFAADGGLHVWGLWTDPAHRGRGHGRAILDLLLAERAAAGVQVHLHVNVANPAARAFYESYGFVRTGELVELRSGSDEVIELMRLDPPAR